LTIVAAVADKIIPVKASQPLIGAEPQIAVVSLRDGSHSVLRQAVLLGPDSSGVLRERLVRIEPVEGNGSGEGERYGASTAHGRPRRIL
jgi:hypothetical protein